MAQQGGKFFHYLLIVIFAAAVVALAGAQLHRRYHRGKHTARGTSGQLVRDLHGEVNAQKASMARGPSSSSKRSEEKFVKEEPAPARPPAPDKSSKQPSATVKSSDELGWSDKRQLNDLIDNLAP